MEPVIAVHLAAGFQDALDRYGVERPRALEPVEYDKPTDPEHTLRPRRAPASLTDPLRPAHEVVPFRGREDELADPTSRAERPGPAACLVHGPGGQGKSRLARRLCHGLAARHWAVLWAGPDGPLDRLPDPPPAVPLLVVVDGAERRTRASARVLEWASRWHSAQVKVLVLARWPCTAGAWPSSRYSAPTAPWCSPCTANASRRPGEGRGPPAPSSRPWARPVT
ncbi:ATP-binding protein [Streptomyces capparidis]